MLPGLCCVDSQSHHLLPRTGPSLQRLDFLCRSKALRLLSGNMSLCSNLAAPAPPHMPLNNGCCGFFLSQLIRPLRSMDKCPFVGIAPHPPHHAPPPSLLLLEPLLLSPQLYLSLPLGLLDQSLSFPLPLTLQACKRRVLKGGCPAKESVNRDLRALLNMIDFFLFFFRCTKKLN